MQVARATAQVSLTALNHCYTANALASVKTDPASAPEPASPITWRDTQQDIRVRTRRLKAAGGDPPSLLCTPQGTRDTVTSVQ